MKRTLLVLSLLCAASAHAQLYKWTGPDGKINYTDTPPPATGKLIDKKSFDGGGSSTESLPFELAEAAKNNPVTLYTSSQCVPCDEGRAFLKSRGIPFSEKTVTSNDDMKKLHQVSNSNSLPALTIGRNNQTGFESGAWGSALTAAGYPESNKLSPTYRFAQPEAASPAAKQIEKRSADIPPNEPKNTPPPPAKNAPPGFQF